MNCAQCGPSNVLGLVRVHPLQLRRLLGSVRSELWRPRLRLLRSGLSLRVQHPVHILQRLVTIKSSADELRVSSHALVPPFSLV